MRSAASRAITVAGMSIPLAESSCSERILLRDCAMAYGGVEQRHALHRELVHHREAVGVHRLRDAGDDHVGRGELLAVVVEVRAPPIEMHLDIDGVENPYAVTSRPAGIYEPAGG